MLTNPRSVFGVHSLTTFRRDDGTPYGPELRVIQGSTFSIATDLIGLKGGSSKFDWAVEDGDATAELSFGVSEYPNWLFEVFGGKAPTQGAAEAAGDVTDLVNKKGTSVIAATGFLAAITVDDASELKFGRFVLKATGVDSAKLFALSDVDFSRGTKLEITDDTMEIANITGIGTGSTHAITNLGITFVAGASGGAMTDGDTTTFEIRPVNTFNRVVKLGGISDIFPEFGAVVYAQKRSTGSIFEINIYRLKNSGITLGAARKEWAANEYTATAMYDSDEDGVCTIIEVE